MFFLHICFFRKVYVSVLFLLPSDAGAGFLALAQERMGVSRGKSPAAEPDELGRNSEFSDSRKVNSGTSETPYFWLSVI